MLVQISVIFLILFSSLKTGVCDSMYFYFGAAGPPGTDEVHIGNTAIVMPLNRILIVKKDYEFGAVKFTKFWTGKTESDLYASCECYYQGDKSGNFKKSNVKKTIIKLAYPKPRGIGRLAFSFGNKEIKCGSIKLVWSGYGAVHFYAQGKQQGDYGIELAPTNWNDISQVNVFLSEIEWYKFDKERPRKNIPLSKLAGNP